MSISGVSFDASGARSKACSTRRPPPQVRPGMAAVVCRGGMTPASRHWSSRREDILRRMSRFFGPRAPLWRPAGL